MPFHFQVYHESKNLNFHKAETISLIDKFSLAIQTNGQ